MPDLLLLAGVALLAAASAWLSPVGPLLVIGVACLVAGVALASGRREVP